MAPHAAAPGPVAEAGAIPRGFGDWVASMSHELRTPLNAILGYADLLLLGLPREIPDESKLQVDRMRLAAGHLLQLLDEILTFARVEAGTETVRLESVVLDPLLREAAVRLERHAAQRPVRVVVTLPDWPLTVMTDVDKLRTILTHLGACALGRTERGTITFAAREEPDAVVLEVRDTGIGIPADRLAHLFDPFWQSPNASLAADACAGAGAAGARLGLTIAGLLTRLLGGDITVRSREGIGSNFAIRLPRRAEPRAD